MATTSLWRVKGQLDKTIRYAMNPEKTEELENVMDYVMNQDKTEDGISMTRYVTGLNCDPDIAHMEMMAVKQRFGKLGGTVAYHGYQSFAKGEVTPAQAHAIGVKLAEQLWGDRHQVVVTTHLDKDSHLHSHFVVNTVSFVDGRKYHRSKKDYQKMQQISDDLCREYGLSVVERTRGSTRHYAEWQAEQENRPTWRGLIRKDVDQAIDRSMTERQFWDALKAMGYEIKLGKDISLCPQGKERFVRLVRNFGEAYSLEAIRKRILEHARPPKLPEPKTKQRVIRKLPKRKYTGFRALYFYYCYLLGVFPGSKSQNSKRIHFLCREELLKLDAISQEAKLLARCHIDTGEQLFAYQRQLENRYHVLYEERERLYRQLHGSPGNEELKRKIEGMKKTLSHMRKELAVCRRITERVPILVEKVHTVETDKNEREVNEHELRRRRGGTGRENDAGGN